MSTIFSRILSGEIPCHKIYETDLVLAFLDISPLSYGHTLVIPKEEKAQYHELSDASVQALSIAVKKIAQTLIQLTDCQGYNLLQNNGAIAHQAVFHVHFHIIPRFADSGLELVWKTQQLDSAKAQSFVQQMQQKMVSF